MRLTISTNSGALAFNSLSDITRTIYAYINQDTEIKKITVYTFIYVGPYQIRLQLRVWSCKLALRSLVFRDRPTDRSVGIPAAAASFWSVHCAKTYVCALVSAST